MQDKLYLTNTYYNWTSKSDYKPKNTGFTTVEKTPKKVGTKMTSYWCEKRN